MSTEMEYKSKKIGIKIFFLFLFIYIFFMSGHMGGDSMFVYLTTESIVLDGNLVLNDHPEREFGITEMKDVYNFFFNVTKEEKVYSKYQLGEVIIQIPFFIIGYILSLLYSGIHGDYITMFFVSMANCFVTALLCFFFFKLLKLFNISDKISILVTIALGLSTFIFPFSKQGFREPIVGFCILLGAYYIIKYKMFYLEKYLLFSGIAIGYAIFTRFDSLYIIPPFLLYIFLVKNNKRLFSNILYFIYPIVFFVLIIFITNYSTRNDILNFGYVGLFNYLILFNPIGIIVNIYGFFFSSGKSFFLYAPVAVLFFFSISKFIRVYKDEAWFFLSIIIVNLGFYSLVLFSFYGGWNWGPRFQYSIIPFFLLSVGVLLQSDNNRIFIFKILLILGIFIQLPSVLVNDSLISQSIRNEIWYKYEFRVTGDFNNDSLITGFIPQYSPILWGYYQITSAINSSIGGESLKIPIDYYVGKKRSYIDFRSIDFWDIWFFNVFRIVKDNLIVKILTSILAITQLFLILMIVLSLRKELLT